MNAIETLNRWAETWAAVMWGSLVDATVILLVVAIVWLLFRRRMSAQIVYCLFLLVLIKLTVPIHLSLPGWTAQLSPRHQFDRITQWSEGEPAPGTPTNVPKMADIADRSTMEDSSFADSEAVSQPSGNRDANVQPDLSDQLAHTISMHQDPAAPQDSAILPAEIADVNDGELHADMLRPYDAAGAENFEPAQSPAVASHESTTAAVVAATPATIIPAALTPNEASLPGPHVALSISALLMLGWTVVVAGLFLAFAWMQWRLFASTRESAEIDSDVLSTELERLARRVGLRRPPRVIQSDLVASPAVCGLFRPKLLLPFDLTETLSPAQINWVILHELAHIVRRDLWVVTFQRLVQIVFFFNPAVWIANRMINRQREYACDDAALATCDASRGDCGRAFLSIVERANGVSIQPSPLLGVFSPKRFFKRRLQRILDKDRPLRTKMTAGSALLLICVAAIVLPTVEASQEKPADDRTEASTTSSGDASDSKPDDSKAKLTAGEAEKSAALEAKKTAAQKLVKAVLARSRAIHSGRFIFQTKRTTLAGATGWPIYPYDNQAPWMLTEKKQRLPRFGGGDPDGDDDDRAVSSTWVIEHALLAKDNPPVDTEKRPRRRRRRDRDDERGGLRRATKKAPRLSSVYDLYFGSKGRPVESRKPTTHFVFSIAGKDWALRYPRHDFSEGLQKEKILVNSDGRFFDYQASRSDYQASGSKGNPTSRKLTIDHIQPLQTQQPQPPLNAGTIWYGSARRFIEQNADKARMVDAPDHEKIKRKILEWDVSAEDSQAAFGEVNDMLKKGGTLRLYVVPSLGHAVHLIEHVDIFGTPQAQFEFLDFKKVAEGIYFPGYCYLTRHVTQTHYTIQAVEKINEEIPKTDFVLPIPSGTHVQDKRPKTGDRLQHLPGPWNGLSKRSRRSQFHESPGYPFRRFTTGAPYPNGFPPKLLKELDRDVHRGDLSMLDDRNKLQGTWRAVSVEFGGEMNKGPLRGSSFLTIQDDGIVWTYPGGSKVAYLFWLNQEAGPRQINLSTGGRGSVPPVGLKTRFGPHITGIYKVDSDTLTLCLADAQTKFETAAKHRPAKFVSRFNGEDFSLIVLKRVRGKTPVSRKKAVVQPRKVTPNEPKNSSVTRRRRKRNLSVVPQSKPRPDDKAWLKGSWDIVSDTRNDIKADPGKALRESNMIFRDDKVIWKELSGESFEYVMTLDQNYNPPKITLRHTTIHTLDDGRTRNEDWFHAGIYEIRGNKLRISLCHKQYNLGVARQIGINTFNSDIRKSIHISLIRRRGVNKPAPKEKGADDQSERPVKVRQKRGAGRAMGRSGFSGIQDDIQSIRTPQSTSVDIKE